MPQQLKPTAFNPKFLLFVSGLSFIVGVVVTASLYALGSEITETFEGIPFDQETDTMMARLFRLPVMSLFIGILCGIPVNLWFKRHLKVSRQEVLQAMLTPKPASMNLSQLILQMRRGLLEVLPILASILLAVGIAFLSGIAIFPVKFGPGITLFLWYPEYKSLYEEAHRQLHGELVQQ